MIIPIHQIIFFIFAFLLVGSSLLVVLSRHTVRAALFLILAFIVSAVLWMMLQAEFLALALIFVYVGAVLTLFLYVVMMIDSDSESYKHGFMRFLPLAIVVLALLLIVTLAVIGYGHTIGAFSFTPSMKTLPVSYSNTTQLGTLLYTHYLYPFEIAGAILLVAIIGSITLAFFGPNKRARIQNVSRQHKASKATGVRLVDLRKEDQE